MKVLSFIFIFVLLATISHANPPEDCLNEISIAMENGDSAAFMQLVDMDAILDSALDTFLAEIQKPENLPRLGPLLALLLSQASGQGGQAVRNLLKNETKSFVINGISTGSFAGKQLSSGQLNGYLAPLFANASTGRKEIRNVGASVADGDGWLTPFSIHDYGNGNDYPVIGKFVTRDGKTKLIEIENLDQLFNQIRREAGMGDQSGSNLP